MNEDAFGAMSVPNQAAHTTLTAGLDQIPEFARMFASNAIITVWIKSVFRQEIFAIMKRQNDRVIVGIPVKNEVDRISDCLRALSFQQNYSEHAIVLLLNDCVDNTSNIIEAMRPTLPVHIFVKTIYSSSPEEACAGFARRAAMEAAVDMAGPGGIILTTDADGRVAPDWISSNLRHIQSGADAVMGQALICPREAALIPDRLHEDDAEECAYGAILDEISSILDPDPADPWPRHNEHSGASIAVTVAAYQQAGGIPAVTLGEDRAFYQALRSVDARIRHATDVKAIVSGRLHGRAPGGMADTMRRRLVTPDVWLDDKLESVSDAVNRYRLRNRIRQAWQSPSRPLRAVAEHLGIDAQLLRNILQTSSFGNAWVRLEHESVVLAKRRMPVSDMATQTQAAVEFRNELRANHAVKDLNDNGARAFGMPDTKMM